MDEIQVTPTATDDVVVAPEELTEGEEVVVTETEAPAQAEEEVTA